MSKDFDKYIYDKIIDVQNFPIINDFINLIESKNLFKNMTNEVLVLSRRDNSLTDFKEKIVWNHIYNNELELAKEDDEKEIKKEEDKRRRQKMIKERRELQRQASLKREMERIAEIRRCEILNNKYIVLQNTCEDLNKIYDDDLTPLHCVKEFTKFKPTTIYAKPSEVKFEDIIKEHREQMLVVNTLNVQENGEISQHFDVSVSKITLDNENQTDSIIDQSDYPIKTMNVFSQTNEQDFEAKDSPAPSVWESKYWALQEKLVKVKNTITPILNQHTKLKYSEKVKENGFILSLIDVISYFDDDYTSPEEDLWE
jgi:hypothetical protein